MRITHSNFFPFGETNNSGNLSFFHPLNQFKGMGINFYSKIDSVTGYESSWPQIVFTNTDMFITKIGNIIP